MIDGGHGAQKEKWRKDTRKECQTTAGATRRVHEIERGCADDRKQHQPVTNARAGGLFIQGMDERGSRKESRFAFLIDRMEHPPPVRAIVSRPHAGQGIKLDYMDTRKQAKHKFFLLDMFRRNHLSPAVTSQARHERPTRPTASRRRVAFVHIPKTGENFANTLAHFAIPHLPDSLTYDMIRQNFSARPELFWNQSYSEWVHPPMGAPGDHAPQKRLHALGWLNHMGVDSATATSWSGSLFGMFRNPALRAQSCWNHFCENSALRCNRTREEYAERIVGMATKQLAGQAFGLSCIASNPNGRRKYGCSQAKPAIQVALSRLPSYAFVGIVEDWALSICLFHAMFGGKCRSSEFVKYTLNSKRLASVTDATFAGVYDPYDWELYSAARARFALDMRVHKVTPARCRATICPAAPYGTFEHGTDGHTLGATTKECKFHSCDTASEYSRPVER